MASFSGVFTVGVDWARIALLVIFIGLAGCGSGGPRYHVVRENVSDVDIDNVVVRFGSFETLPTFLRAGTSKHMLHVGDDHPFPEMATLLWSTPQGVSTSRTVLVPLVDSKRGKVLEIIFRLAESNDLQVLVR